jgi:hypothetical protein
MRCGWPTRFAGCEPGGDGGAGRWLMTARRVNAMPRTERWILVWIVLVLGAVAAFGQTRSAQTRRPMVALAAQIEVERELLLEDLERFERLARKRDLAAGRVAELHRSVDATVRTGVTASPEQVDALVEQLTEAESERRALHDEELDLVRKIRDRRRTIALLVERVDTARGLMAEVGALAGDWDVVLLPIEQRGVFTLQQSGTLVNGTYLLDGGWSGSLQGTLVNRKVFLVRIDSKLGRVMELEGYLSAEGDRIRGTWLNYEVAGAEGSNGQWSAQRRAEEP